MKEKKVKFFYCEDVNTNNLRAKVQIEISDFINELYSNGSNFLDIKTSLNTNGELFIILIYEVEDLVYICPESV